MPPHFVVKGARGPKCWGNHTYNTMLAMGCFHDATLSVQANGWMDNEIFLTWFEECFLPFTASRRTAMTPMVLVLDNFNGHVHPATLRTAKENNVIMVGLPHHNTHHTTARRGPDEAPEGLLEA